MPRPPRWSPDKLLLAAFVLVAACFWFSSLFTQSVESKIDDASDRIAFKSSPAIERLAAIWAETRHLEKLLDDYVDARADGEPASRAPVDASSRRLHDEAAAYMELPRFQEEQPASGALEQSLPRLDAAVAHALVLADGSEPTQAQLSVRTEVRTHADTVVDAAERALDVNAQYGHDLALSIQRSRHHAMFIGIGLDVFAGILTFLAARIVLRGMRRHDEVQQAATRLAQDRASELDAFAGRVAHDILNPVTAARLNVQQVRRSTSEDKIRQLALRGVHSLDRVRVIVDDLLWFSRVGAEPDVLARADATEVIDGVIADLQSVAEDARVVIHVDAAGHAICKCSTGVLTSLVSNLVRNAIKYMGTVPARRIDVRVLGRPGKVRLEVEDTGPGLPPELEATVFEPFVRARGNVEPGIGLGLAIVKRLAEGHHGAVGFRSRPGHGCLFWVELPRARADVGTEATVAPT